MIEATITSRINQETLRKCLISLSDNGLSGVSSGHRTKIQTVDNEEIINSNV